MMEKVQINLPKETMRELRKKAFNKGVTISWILRIILRNPKKAEVKEATRPKKLIGEYQKFDLCLHDSKPFWMIFVRGKGFEFGPYLRKLLEYYVPRLESLDYDSPRFNRLVRSISIKRYTNGIQIRLQHMHSHELRPKNEEMNLFLMKRRLKEEPFSSS